MELEIGETGIAAIAPIAAIGRQGPALVLVSLDDAAESSRDARQISTTGDLKSAPVQAIA
jgi:hypothetical protein